MIIEKNSVVSMDYTLTNDAGEEIDSSRDRGPLSFIQGSGHIIPGLDSQLLGKKAGDSFNVRVAPADAYGERDEELIKVIPREHLAGIPDLEVGMPLQARLDDNNVMVVTVTAIDANTVTLDGNHPLAGVALNFDVKVTDVREATPEELSHGHLHSHDHDEEGGCGGGGCGGCGSHGEGGCGGH
jgi:FKBP-type peptidyl-prolyl cis-trans isomerase SlyD